MISSINLEILKAMRKVKSICFKIDLRVNNLEYQKAQFQAIMMIIWVSKSKLL